MFEKVTGFFRRFRSKRKTTETAMLSPDEGLDDFGLDDADFGVTIGSTVFGGVSLGGESLGGESAVSDEALSAELDSLSGVETFETLGDDSLPVSSLAGGSGESQLEDSQPHTGTFESLEGSDSDAGGGAESLGDDLDDFGGGFEDLDAGGAPDDLDADLALPGGPVEPARVRPLVLLGMLVVGLAVGVGGGIVAPSLLGQGGGIPLDQQLQKVQSDLRKGERSLKVYNALGGLAAIEQLKVDLAAAVEQFATLEVLDAAVEEARAQEQVYDAVLVAAQDAERSRAEHEVARQALALQIAKARAQLKERRRALTAALANYQRYRQAMEASAVVVKAFDEADQRYTHDRVQQMGIDRPLQPAGE